MESIKKQFSEEFSPKPSSTSPTITVDKKNTTPNNTPNNTKNNTTDENLTRKLSQVTKEHEELTLKLRKVLLK